MGVPYAEVIGDPISHSKSPLIHNFWLEKLGLDGEYRATQVAARDLSNYLTARREDPLWRGCNVTMPHKQYVLPLLDTVTRNASAIGAVNTIRRGKDGRLHGRNTDVHGVWRCLDGVETAGKHFLLIGAGGAARAAAYAVSRYDDARVTVMNRSHERAKEMLMDCKLQGDVLPIGDVPDADVVINASSLGMAGVLWPEISLRKLNPQVVVFDMVYSPLHTTLLSRAEAMGLRTIDGLSMLINQASEAFAVFFQARHPANCTTDLRELLLR